MDGDLDRLAFIIASVYKNELLPSEEFVDIVADDLELIRETIEEVSELQPRFPWIPGEITLTFKKPKANPKANSNNEGNSNDDNAAAAADVNGEKNEKGDGEKNEKGENEKNENIDIDSPFVKYREGKIPELKEADDKYGIVATHTIESLQQMHLKFSKPYDSQQLANEYFNLLSNKIDNNNNNNIIKSSEPNMIPGDGDHLTIEFVIEPDEDDDDDKDEKQKQPAAAEGSNEEENYPDDDDDDGIISNSGGTRQYCFSKGWGKDDGPNGCVHRHTWKIAVIDDQVKMIDEYGTTIRDENDVCFGSSGGCNIM